MNKSNIVLFIKTRVPLLQDDKLEPDMGLLYCATYVKNHCGCKVVYVDLSLDGEDVLQYYFNKCDIYCFSTFTANYHITLEIVKKIRQISNDAVVIAGGHHASALPYEVAKSFDYVIKGEGELAISELISNLLKGEMPGERIIIGKYIKDLDEIGWIDYSLVQLERYTRRVNGRKSISILTSRGCPYNCTFCNSTLMRSYRNVRFRSANDVVNEILFLNRKYGIDSFRIQDDIFSINRPRLKAISNALEPFHFSFRCFARVDNIDHEILFDLKKMGVFHLSFGVESGSQRMLDLMNKGITVENIKNSIRLSKQYGMKCRVFLIVGYPGENLESLDETIQLIREIKPNDISVYPLLPYPGTPLFHNPKKYGITYIDKDFSKYYQIYGNKESGYVFETSEMSLDKLHYYRDYLVAGISKVCPWAIDDEDNR